MYPIHPDDPAWLTTFQHLVEPKHDEWLPGLLLRCDKVNGWESGTTLAELLRSSGRYFLNGKPSWTVVPTSALEWLSQVLALPMNALLATTYQSELARLYGTSS